MRVFILAIAVALAACATGPAPQGFAPYRGKTVRAVSPEGVVFKAQVIDNKPEADIAFWAEALRRRQENAGYKVIDQSTLEAAGLSGSLLEMETPWGAQDYAYLIAIFVDGKKLHVIEAAGEVQDLALHRDAILSAIDQTLADR